MTGPVFAAILSTVAALGASAFGLISATKANRPAQSNAQLAWVKQAQDEATEARHEAREAKAESAAARTESEATRVQLVKMRREFDGMQDWVDRVVRARDAYLSDHAEVIQSAEDSGLIRLIKAINGGPRYEG